MGEGLGPFYASLFFSLGALDRFRADRQLAGLYSLGRNGGREWGKQTWAQLAGGIEMGPRDSIQGLEAQHSHGSHVSLEQARQELSFCLGN